MKPWLKGTALCLAIILICSMALGGCAPAANPDFTDPTETTGSTVPETQPTVPTTQPTEPTKPTETEPVTEPVTQPPTEPETQPPTEPVTEPTDPSTAPTQPAATQPTLTDPPASEAVTIGNYISGISAKKAFVYDCSDRKYLYMKGDADAKLYPASITKLMNAYTALKYVDLDTVITVGKDILDIVPDDTSRAGLYAGDRMTLEMVLRAMLIPSGSDAAHIMAVVAGRLIAGDPGLDAQAAEDLFVAEMNRQAELLGLVNTHFVHADGYHDYYHYTCMADLTTIAAVCLETPAIRDTVRRSGTYLEFQNRSRVWVSTTNRLLQTSSAYYRSEARGMKTGTTESAGCCLLSAFLIGDRYVIIGVFKCSTNSVRYRNATLLFNTFKAILDPDSSTPTAPSEPTQPTEPTNSTEVTEPTQPTEPAGSTEATEPTQPTEPTGSTEVTEPTLPTEPTGSTEVTEPTPPTEPTGSTNATEPTQPTEPAQPTEATQPTQGTEPTQVTEPTVPHPTSPAAEATSPAATEETQAP